MSTCGQALHDDKKEELAIKKNKELEDAIAYQKEVGDKVTSVTNSLEEIGDINGKPTTFYETIKEVYDLNRTLHNYKRL